MPKRVFRFRAQRGDIGPVAVEEDALTYEALQTEAFIRWPSRVDASEGGTSSDHLAASAHRRRRRRRRHHVTIITSVSDLSTQSPIQSHAQRRSQMKSRRRRRGVKRARNWTVPRTSSSYGTGGCWRRPRICCRCVMRILVWVEMGVKAVGTRGRRRTGRTA